MKSSEEIKQEDTMSSDKDFTYEISTESIALVDEPAEMQNENETIVEVSAPVVHNSSINDDENPIEVLRRVIDQKIEHLEANEQYISLQNIITDNLQLIKDGQKRIIAVKNNILYANKYVKELADKFLDILSSTGWFERYYDAVCLFDRAHDTSESLEWCEAMKDSIGTSIADNEKVLPKIKVLLNRRVANSVFTLSVKTPYLRLKETSFCELKSFISNQSKLFYSWLKNIESLSLLLRDHWLELEFPLLKKDTYLNVNGVNLEKLSGVPLSQYVEAYVGCNITNDNERTLYKSIIYEVDSFIENITEIVSFHKNQYEENMKVIKYFTETLLYNYYRKELEAIYSIYDGIQLSIDALTTKFEHSEERENWCSLLNSLADTVINFLSSQNINLSPKLIVGESHIDNSKFEINNQQVEFFSFAKIAFPTEAPCEELKDYVASIRNYGFYHIDSENNVKIIRDTVVSVYN